MKEQNRKYETLYQRLAQLPPQELAQLLAEVFPPGEIEARMDGTVFIIHAYGLRRFQSTADLSAVGIPVGDPRRKVYDRTMRNLIPLKIQNLLNSHARSKIETVCRNQGAIRVNDYGRGQYAWWVEVSKTNDFLNAIERHIAAFHDLRDQHLIDKYDELHESARRRYEDALIEAWRKQYENEGETPTKDEYIAAGMSFFDQRFPTIAEIKREIRMEVEPVQKTLPGVIRHEVEAIRQAEIEALEAEKRAHQSMREREDAQLHMLALERQEQFERLKMLEDERQKRDRLLLEAVRPEINQMQEAMERVMASTTLLADEIIRAAQNDEDITAATAKSWNTRLARLQQLAPTNPRIGDAVHALRQLKDETKEGVSRQALESARRRVAESLNDLAVKTGRERTAEAIFTLLQDGRSSEALNQLQILRKSHRSNLEELDDLYEYMLKLGSVKEQL